MWVNKSRIVGLLAYHEVKRQNSLQVDALTENEAGFADRAAGWHRDLLWVRQPPLCRFYP